MPNYNKCYIYKICCKDPTITDCYIGSTTNIIRRRSDHKSACTCISRRAYNRYVYTFIRNNGGWENWTMTLLEEFSCETKMQQLKKERDFIEQLKPTLNKMVPAKHQTGEVYDLKEYRKKYDKEYYDQNKKYILERNREYNKEYKETNKEAIKEYQQKEIHCPCCNHMINLNNRSNHNRTKKHIRNSSSQSDTPVTSDSESD